MHAAFTDRFAEDEIRRLPPALTVEQAAGLLRIGRSQAYQRSRPASGPPASCAWDVASGFQPLGFCVCSVSHLRIPTRSKHSERIEGSREPQGKYSAFLC
jgi:hypothetical protein